MIKVNDTIINQQQFPDGTLLLKTEGIEMSDITITWLYENDSELFSIICLAKKAIKKKLVMPYIPHARMDRCKAPEDTFTLKYFAEIINSLGFDKVTVLDPHSNVSVALIDRVEALNPKAYIDKVVEEIGADNLMLFFPDEGSMKRYSDMSTLPYAFGIKKRDWKTGNILGLDVIDNGLSLAGKKILIIDDICSRGGTFYHSAKKLKELGAGDVYLYITHCENTILEGDVLTSGLIEKVYTTNSIFNKEHEKVEVYAI